MKNHLYLGIIIITSGILFITNGKHETNFSYFPNSKLEETVSEKIYKEESLSIVSSPHQKYDLKSKMKIDLTQFEKNNLIATPSTPNSLNFREENSHPEYKKREHANVSFLELDLSQYEKNKPNFNKKIHIPKGLPSPYCQANC